jgi:hypothetical protein
MSDSHEGALLRPGDGWRLLGVFMFFGVGPASTVYVQTEMPPTGNPVIDSLAAPIAAMLFCMMMAVVFFQQGNAKRIQVSRQ